MSRAFLADLRQIVGAGYVLVGDDTAKWSQDWTKKIASTPMAVVRPATTAEIAQVLVSANRHRVPVVPVSGNTSLCGGTQANESVVLSVDRLNTIRKLDPRSRVAVVEAGVVLADLQEAARREELEFPLNFGAKGSAMIGGCLATNAGGSNVLRYGNARELCLGIEAVLPTGEVLDVLTELHKDNTGYDLKHLLIGSEGSLGIITAATVKLVPKPRAYATAMIAPKSLDDAIHILNSLQEETGGAVEAFEYMPRNYIEEYLTAYPQGRNPFETLHDTNVLVELATTVRSGAVPNDDGTVPVVEQLIEFLSGGVEDGALENAVVAANETQRQEMWAIREAAGHLAHGHPRALGNDVSVPIDRVSSFIHHVQSRLEEIDPDIDALIVAHLGDGNVHYSVRPSTDDPKVRAAIAEAVSRQAVAMGGSFSAEHGIGQTKLTAMSDLKNAVALSTMRAIKGALDPIGILNPGKVIPPEE